MSSYLDILIKYNTTHYKSSLAKFFFLCYVVIILFYFNANILFGEIIFMRDARVEDKAFLMVWSARSFLFMLQWHVSR